MRNDHAGTQPTDLATLRAVTTAAADIFTAAPRRHAALTYLRQRGVDTSSLPQEWVLGYAPPGWTRIVDKLRGQFPDQALIGAGIARRSSRGTLIDTFRDRVIFGVRQTDGIVAGFIARDLSGDTDTPKYLNTCRHALFDKSVLLYGLYEGDHALHARQPVIVEGPLDVLAIASHAQREGDGDLLPVAACGTAITRSHAVQVATVAFAHQSPVVVALDSDGPGRLAALAVGDKLRSVGLDVRVATLPNGSDPAEYLTRTDATVDTFRADNALPLFAMGVQHAIAQQGDRIQWIEGRLAALRTIAGCLATYPASYAVRQAGWLASTLGLDGSTVSFEIAEVYRRASRRYEGPALNQLTVASQQPARAM